MATTTGCKFGDADLIIPDPADERFAYALRLGANSYVCPVGPEPGRGWLVMERADLEGMDLTEPQKLTWRGNIANAKTIGSPRTFELENLYVVNDPIRIDTSGDDAPGSLYLVEITDIRHHAKHFSALNAAYNLRKPGSAQGAVGGTEDRYYDSTLNSGVLYTWSTLCEAIWDSLSDLLGDYPGLPYSPAGTPEDFRFVGVTAWGALHAVLDQIGCTTALDPSLPEDQIDIVRLGTTQAGLTAKEDKYDAICPRMYSFDAYAARATRIPETIRVFFQYRDETSPANWINLAYEVDVATAIEGAVAGTVLGIWDSEPARYDFDDAAVSNSAALATRAAEVAANWLAIHNVSKGRKVYGEIIADILPGEEVRAVEWRNSGDSWQTTVFKRPDVCLELWPTKFAEPVSLERLASQELLLFGYLTTPLAAGGSADCFARIFHLGSWTNTVGASSATFTVWDSVGDKTGDPNDIVIALFSLESQRYELIQVLCV